MGYIFDYKDVLAYDRWLKDPSNRLTIDLETRLMVNMLKPGKGETLLSIGSGMGTGLDTLTDMGILVTGLEPSVYMLDRAKSHLGDRVDFHRGFAEDLPFEDNTFNYACFMTSLEFMENPGKAIEEACRVTKNRIFIGVLNRYALKGVERRIKSIFKKTIYSEARFFSIWEIKYILISLLGPIPISWRTVCHLPSLSGKTVNKIEQSHIIQRSPFGAFAGITAVLVPRYRVKPLTIKYPTGAVTG